MVRWSLGPLLRAPEVLGPLSWQKPLGVVISTHMARVRGSTFLDQSFGVWEFHLSWLAKDLGMDFGGTSAIQASSLGFWGLRAECSALLAQQLGGFWASRRQGDEWGEGVL